MQAQAALQEGKGVEHPARAVRAWDFCEHVGIERDTAPGRDGTAQVRLVALVTQFQQSLRLARHGGGELEQVGLPPRQRGRSFQPHHGVLLAGAQGQAGVFGGRLQAEFACQPPLGHKAHIANDGQGHGLVQACAQPLAHLFAPSGRNEAGKPRHHTGVTVGLHVGGQRLAHIGIVHHIAHMVERHLQIAVRVGVVQCRRLIAVVEHQHAPRHRLHTAHAHAGQGGVCDPRNDAVLLNALRRAACQGAIVCGHVVNGQHRHAIALLDGAQLLQQPCAAGFRHFFVALGFGIPAAVERFRRHHGHLARQLGHQLKAPVEDQLDAGKALVQRLYHAHQALLLGLFVKRGGQAVAVERIEEKPPVAPLPQGGNHPLSKEGRPFRLALVDHFRLPVLVARQLPGGRNIAVIGPRWQHLGDRYVGIKLGVWQRGGGGSRFVVGLNHHDVKRPKVRAWQILAVVQRHGRWWCGLDSHGQQQPCGVACPAAHAPQQALNGWQSRCERGTRRHRWMIQNVSGAEF